MFTFASFPLSGRMLAPVVLAVLTLGVARAQSGSVLISEFATRGLAGNASGEYVELYNPTNADVSISEWKLWYRSASGSTYSVMATIPSGTVLPSHSYYLLAGTTWNGVVTPDVKWATTGMADNGTIRLTTASDVEIDRVGFGTGNDPKGSNAPNHGDTANDNCVERRASATSTAASLWVGGAEEFAGNPYNSDNNGSDFIVQTNGRNPQNSTSPPEPKTAEGSGTAIIPLARMKGGEAGDIPVVFTPTPGMPLTTIRIVVPGEFTWSRTAADVVLGPTLTATTRVVDDSVFIDAPTFSADSGLITLRTVTAPFQTASFTFLVSTSGGGTLRPIQLSPVLVVQGGPMAIADARMNDASGVPVRLNQFVTINGIVTASNQFGSPAYIQDATAGVAVYDFTFSDGVAIGDEVTLTGKVTQFNGLTELTEVTIDKRVSTGNQVTPIEVTINDLLTDGVNGMEKWESSLILLRNVTVNTTTWAVTGSGTNYKISDGSREMDIRISKSVDFVGQAAPGGSFDVVGIVSQYQRTSPFVGGYQLMPRMGSDISSKGPRIITLPYESDIQPTEVTYTWQTGASAESHVRYGLTSAFELGVASGTTSGTQQSVTITGLQPGTIHQAIAFSVANGDTSWSQRMYFVTASATSTGDTKVYFNKSVDNTLPIPVPAEGNVNLKLKLLDRIDAAHFSIDVCLYSLSGNVGEEVVASLISAANRGVKVRAIVEADNANTAPIRTLRTAVPVILDTFDPINAGAGLMHNKFFIIDARDRSSDLDDFLITGSWNTTDEGTNSDAQNAVFIQDQAITTVYQREFEEMWGSSTDTPNSTSSRFGARKMNNTPHQVMITGTRFESFFSPSDQTTNYLVRSANAATTSLYSGIMTFTRDDLATAMVNKAKAGVIVRLVMDNSSDQGSEFNYLKTNGIDVLLKGNLSGILHHKYLIIDAENTNPGSDPMVITGSHNWSNAAESSNNENTIGIHTRTVALQYLAEWYQRYKDAGGKGSIVLHAGDAPAVATPALSQSWPNPLTASSSTATIGFSTTSHGAVRLTVFDMLGREVAVPVSGIMPAGAWTATFDASRLGSGSYMYRLDADGRSTTRFLVVAR